MTSFAFGKNRRLLNSSDFSHVFNDAPYRASHPNFLILACPGLGDGPRLGIVVAKKHVRLAVGRNRIKRYIRESFRARQHKLPSIDAIVLARRGADTLTDEDLQQVLDGLWKRVAKKAMKANPDLGRPGS